MAEDKGTFVVLHYNPSSSNHT